MTEQSTDIAVIVERIAGLERNLNQRHDQLAERQQTAHKETQDDIAGIRRDMATREKQEHTDSTIVSLVQIEAAEKAERIAADQEEKRERIAEVKSVRDRLQLVEDRLENRKYMVLTAIVVGTLGPVLSLVLAVLRPGG